MGWDERNGFGYDWIPSLLQYLVSAAPLVTHACCGPGWVGLVVCIISESMRLTS
jgi:hypothetical protein